ncbi:hypothetical protein GCM10027570_04330 [Streptomonospora sediminis]
MKLKKMLATGAVTIACTAGAMVATAGTANADWNQCPAGQVCAWEHSGGNGTMVYGGPTHNMVGYMDKKASSMWNRTDTMVCLYRSDGRYMLLGPGIQRDIPAWINDRITEWKPC